MAMIALLFAAAAPLSGPLKIAGVPLIERQIRQARRAGVSRAFVVGGSHGYGSDVVNIDGAAMLVPRLADSDMVLVLAPGLVIDDRIVTAVIAAVPADRAVPVVATWPAAARLGVERIHALTFAAGVAVYPGALVRRIAAQLGDWDLASTLLRAALSEAGCVRVDLTTVHARHLEPSQLPPVYLLATGPEAARTATTAVLAATAQPRRDAPGRYLYPPIERALLQRLAPGHATPQLLAVLAAAAGLTAAALLLTGWLWSGLALALLFGPLQDLGERLAHARTIFLNWRRWHVFCGVIGYAWWLALAVQLTLMRGNGGPLAVFTLLLFAQVTQASETRIERRRTALPSSDIRLADHRIALFAANRDSLTLLLTPFVLAAQPYAGLIALAGYAAASFAATHARFLQRLAA